MKKIQSLILLIVISALVLSGCSGKQDIERTKELIVGEWDYSPVGESYRYRYSFAEGGTITQSAWIIDENGQEMDISLGDTFGLTYEVIDAETIIIKGAFFGVESEPEKVTIEFPDANTMVLGNSTYYRFGSK